MSVASNENKKSLAVTASEFTATDGSKHTYFTFAGIWMFVGAGAPTETGKTIAGASIPKGSYHINQTTGVHSFYDGAWKAIAASA